MHPSLPILVRQIHPGRRSGGDYAANDRFVLLPSAFGITLAIWRKELYDQIKRSIQKCQTPYENFSPSVDGENGEAKRAEKLNVNFFTSVRIVT